MTNFERITVSLETLAACLAETYCASELFDGVKCSHNCDFCWEYCLKLPYDGTSIKWEIYHCEESEASESD